MMPWRMPLLYYLDRRSIDLKQNKRTKPWGTRGAGSQVRRFPLHASPPFQYRHTFHGTPFMVFTRRTSPANSVGIYQHDIIVVPGSHDSHRRDGVA